MSFFCQVEMHFKATDPCLSVSTTVNWNELFMHPAVASLLLITGQTPGRKYQHATPVSVCHSDRFKSLDVLLYTSCKSENE